MLRALPVLIAGILAACGQAPVPGDIRDADRLSADPSIRVVEMKTRGRVIDSAGVLSNLEEKAIANRIESLRATKGLAVVVVTLVPQGGDSMERVGWAVGGGQDGKRPLLLLVDPKQASVRVEGKLSPEQRAAIAGSMQSELRDGRIGSAIGRGLDRLQVVPT